MSIETDLAGRPPEDYGEKHSEHALEIYKLYVEMADRVSARRQKANSFFLTINTAIVALVGYVQLGSGTQEGRSLHWLVALAGMVLCYLWHRLIKRYDELNAAKFHKVIVEAEKQLPLRPYYAELSHLGLREADSRKQLSLTNIEVMVPWVFFGIHLFVLAHSIPWATIFPGR